MLHIGVDGCKAGWLAIARKGADLDASHTAGDGAQEEHFGFIEERLGLLEQHEPGIRGLLKRVLSETSRKQVAADDVLDNAYRHVPPAEVDRLDPSVDSFVSFGGAYAR